MRMACIAPNIVHPFYRVACNWLSSQNVMLVMPFHTLCIIVLLVDRHVNYMQTEELVLINVQVQYI
jgi:hypothetical protein